MVPFPFLDKLSVHVPSDQSCHHETWLHLQFVDWNNKWNHRSLQREQSPQNDQRVLDMELQKRTRNHLRSLVPSISIAHHHEVTR